MSAIPRSSSPNPTWLASAPEAANLAGYYIEKQKRQQPSVATDRVTQERTLDLAHALIYRPGSAGRE